MIVFVPDPWTLINYTVLETSFVNRQASIAPIHNRLFTRGYVIYGYCAVRTTSTSIPSLLVLSRWFDRADQDQEGRDGPIVNTGRFIRRDQPLMTSYSVTFFNQTIKRQA